MKCIAFAKRNIPFDKSTVMTENIPAIPIIELSRPEIKISLTEEEKKLLTGQFNIYKDAQESMSKAKLTELFRGAEKIEEILSFFPKASLNAEEYGLVAKLVQIAQNGGDISDFKRSVSVAKNAEPEQFYSNFTIKHVEPAKQSFSSELVQLISKARRLCRSIDNRVAYNSIELETLQKEQQEIRQKLAAESSSVAKKKGELTDLRRKINLENDKIAKLEVSLNIKLREDLKKPETMISESINIETNRQFDKIPTNLSIPSMIVSQTDETPEKEKNKFVFPIDNLQDFFASNNNQGSYPEF